MHELVKAASQALSAQDAETMERLLEEARTRVAIPVAINVGELARASHVLTAQVRAAERHLGVRAARGSNPWEL